MRDWTGRIQQAAASYRDRGLSPREKMRAIVVVIAGLLLFGFYISLRYNGPIATIVYSLAFVLAATLIPVSVTVFRGGTPFGGAVGGLQMMLGQLCFGVGYLVERENKYEWCPGTREQVWIDGEWHDIEDGQQNLTQLGWRPFGMLKYKDPVADHPFAEYKPRVQTQEMGTDGGRAKRIERGPAKQKPIDELDRENVVDLKRVMNSNIRQIGGTELIERVEEIIERGEVSESQMSSWGPIVGSIVGLIIGVVVGYGTLYM